MRILILGGKLQGVEAVYLSKKASWETVVIDRNPAVPAAGLCDEFFQADIRKPLDLNRFLKGVDFIMPATENQKTIACLNDCAGVFDIPILFDFRAYGISSSKSASNRLFERYQIPAPAPWPACGFPVVVKPNCGSGSRGVRVFSNPADFHACAERLSGRHVIQQFLQGPQVSVEVVGRSGRYFALQTTELEMDASYDCKRVSAPIDLSGEIVARFESIAVKLAEALTLNGLMDVEAVYHDNTFKILEIDARFPSQTPTAVWWSSGSNLLELLASCFLPNVLFEKPVAASHKGVVYEHIRVKGNRLEVAGEHIMSQAGALSLQKDFFGADEALTNYHRHQSDWVATLICGGATRQKAWEKRNQVMVEIRRHFNLSRYVDAGPFGAKGGRLRT